MSDIDTVPPIPHNLADAVKFAEALVREMKDRQRPSYIDVYLSGLKVWMLELSMKSWDEVLAERNNLEATDKPHRHECDSIGRPASHDTCVCKCGATNLNGEGWE